MVTLTLSSTHTQLVHTLPLLTGVFCQECLFPSITVLTILSRLSSRSDFFIKPSPQGLGFSNQTIIWPKSTPPPWFCCLDASETKVLSNLSLRYSSTVNLSLDGLPLPGWSPYLFFYWSAYQKESESESCSVMSNSLRPHELYSPWNSPGHNTGLPLLLGIFPTQGSNPGLPHCRWILYQLSHKGSPRKLKWVAYPFPSESSWHRNRTRVSCIAGRLFTNWAIREAQIP